MKSVLANIYIYSTSSQTEGTMADGTQRRDAQDKPVMESGSAGQTNRSNSMSNDGNNCRQNKSTESEQVTVAPVLIGNSISRSISYDYTDSTLFPTKSLTYNHGLHDENHRNVGLPKILSPGKWNEGTTVLDPDQWFPDQPSTRRGNARNTDTVAQSPDQGFPYLPSAGRGTGGTTANGPDKGFPDLPSSRRRNRSTTAQDPDQGYPALPSARRGTAGNTEQGPDQAFPDLPSARRGRASITAQGSDLGFPDLQSARRGNAGNTELGPDQAFPDLPSARRGTASITAQGPDQVFPDLPSERRQNAGTVAQCPDQGFSDLPSARRRTGGTAAHGPDPGYPDLPSTSQKSASTTEQGTDKGFPDLPSARRGNTGTVAQCPDQGFPDLPSARQGTGGTAAHGPDQGFPDLPSARRGNTGTVAQCPDQGFPDLPSARRGTGGTAEHGPDQGFPDVPSARRRRASTTAQQPDQAFPDLPFARRGRTSTTAQGPDQGYSDLPSARQGNAGNTEQGSDQGYPDLPSASRGNAGNTEQEPDQVLCDLPSTRQSNNIPIDISDFNYKEIFWMILHNSGSNQENAEGSKGNESPTFNYNVAISYNDTMSVLSQIYQGKSKMSNKRYTRRSIHEMFTQMLTKYISVETFLSERKHRKFKMDKSKLVKLTEALQGLQKGDLKRIHQLIKFSSLKLENIIEVIQLLLLMTELAADAKVSLIQQLKHLSGHTTDPDDSTGGNDITTDPDDSTGGNDIISKFIPTELPTSQTLLPENPLQSIPDEKYTQEPVLPGTSSLQPLLPGTSTLLSETEDEEHDHLSQQQLQGSFPVGEKEIQQLEGSAGCTDSHLQCAPSFYLIAAAQGSAFEPPQTGSNQTGDVGNVEKCSHGKPAAVSDHPQSASLVGPSYRKRVKSDAAGNREVSQLPVDQRTPRIADESISLQIQILKTEKTYTLIRYEDSTLQGLIMDIVHGGTEDIKRNPGKGSSALQ